MQQPGRRIVVVGVAGAGKTTVARTLAERLGIPFVSNDEIIWGPGWRLKAEADEVRLFDAATARPAWTLDGNLNPTSKADTLIMSRLDTIVWTNLPRRQAFPQLLRRTIGRAWTGEELWHGNRESWRTSFFSCDSILWYAIKSHRHVERRYAEMFDDPAYAHVTRIRLRSRREVNAWLGAVRQV
ncbi:MAG: AAA family ATPase [Planctomycetota bacterium]